MHTNTQRPGHIPEAARELTLGELADRHLELKPAGISQLRVCFPFLRFTPHGRLKSITRTKDGSGVELVLVQGGLHPKRYKFNAEPADGGGTAAWIWTAAEDRQMANAV